MGSHRYSLRCTPFGVTAVILRTLMNYLFFGLGKPHRLFVSLDAPFGVLDVTVNILECSLLFIDKISGLCHFYLGTRNGNHPGNLLHSCSQWVIVASKGIHLRKHWAMMEPKHLSRFNHDWFEPNPKVNIEQKLHGSPNSFIYQWVQSGRKFWAVSHPQGIELVFTLR